MRTTLLLMAVFGLLGGARSALPQEEPAGLPVLTRLVWAAVDAGEDRYPSALEAVLALPGITWRNVFGVLSEPRPTSLLVAPRPPRTDFEEHLAWLAAFPWERGVVRPYDIGDDQPSFYSVTLPPGHSVEEPLAVLVELGAFAPEEHAPPGWAVVRFHDHLYHAPDLGGVPFSLTAGTASQCVLLTVLRDLERRIRFDPDRVFVSGYSRGGNAAPYFGTHWPDRFAGIVPAAGYYPVEDAFLGNLDHVAVLAAWGDDPGHRDANAYQKALVGRLSKAGADVTGRAQAGRATDGSLGPDFLAVAASRRRDALPRSFRYALRDPRHRGAYWAEVLEVERTGGLRRVSIGAAETFMVHRRDSRISVEVAAQNEVNLTARNVKTLRLWLSPRLFDLGAPIVIQFAGRSIRHQPAPSVATLLASFRSRRDRALLFPAYVDISR